jgi:hypothetical protein
VKKKAKILAIDQFVPHINQIRVLTFMCTTFGARFIFTKKSNIAKRFLISVMLCRQKLDVISVNKVISKLKFEKLNMVLNT